MVFLASTTYKVQPYTSRKARSQTNFEFTFNTNTFELNFICIKMFTNKF